MGRVLVRGGARVGRERLVWVGGSWVDVRLWCVGMGKRDRNSPLEFSSTAACGLVFFFCCVGGGMDGHGMAKAKYSATL